MAFARRVDANHGEIAGYFERLGCKVHHTIGDWDLTVCRMGVVKLIEVKNSKKPPSKKRLTKRAQRLVDEGWPIRLVETIDDVLKVIDEMMEEIK